MVAKKIETHANIFDHPIYYVIIGSKKYLSVVTDRVNSILYLRKIPSRFNKILQQNISLSNNELLKIYYVVLYHRVAHFIFSLKNNFRSHNFTFSEEQLQEFVLN